MKKRIRLLLNTILIAVLLIAVINFVKFEVESYRSKLDYEEARQIAGEKIKETAGSNDSESQETSTEEYQPPEKQKPTIEEKKGKDLETLLQTDPNIEPLLAIDLDALREVNDDVIGWIQIPDTVISYPLLQWEDNQYYLKHTWKQANSGVGAIFMEYQNNSDFRDFNTIIYGHNLQDRTMFGGLRNYKNEDYLESHPSVYIVNDDGIFRYDIFAVQKADVDSIIYGMKIETTEKREEYIRYALDYSDIETGLIPTAEDRILTLSTCTGTGYGSRWVVQCILNEAESYIKAQ